MRYAAGVMLLVLAAAILTVALAPGPDRVELVKPTQEIPRDSYKAWSLFLVCTPDWVTLENSAGLANLYRRFKAFGDAIGPDNLAVWFWKRQTALADTELSENVDVARSATYCKALKLRPSEGPFVVVTTAYPSLSEFPKERAVFALGALDPATLAKLFNTLTDQLLLEGNVQETGRAATPGAGAPNGSTANAAGRPSAGMPAQSGLWTQLLESTRRSIIGFGCNVKMQISTGVVSAELRGCAGL